VIQCTCTANGVVPFFCSWIIEETYAKLNLKLAAKIATSYSSKG